MKISEFALYIDQLCMESATNGSAGLHASPSQIQEAPDLAEFESQALDAHDKSESLYVVLRVLSEAPLCPRRTREQTVPLVEAYRVNTEGDSFRNGANLHLFGSFSQSYTLEYSPESSPFSRAGRSSGSHWPAPSIDVASYLNLLFMPLCLAGSNRSPSICSRKA